jgi:hypothetical protein
MKVIGWNRTKHADIKVPLVEIDELLTQSDVVSMNLTLGDETRGFLSAERIGRMKKGAIFVNTGFEFDRPPEVPVTPAPSAETLRLMRQVVAPELAEVYPQFASRVFGVTASA